MSREKKEKKAAQLEQNKEKRQALGWTYLSLRRNVYYDQICINLRSTDE